jgi:hypothetical protein
VAERSWRFKSSQPHWEVRSVECEVRIKRPQFENPHSALRTSLQPAQTERVPSPRRIFGNKSARFSKAANLTGWLSELGFTRIGELAFSRGFCLAGMFLVFSTLGGFPSSNSDCGLVPVSGLPPHILETANRQQCRDAKP